ncbi:MAG TPA: PQQ-dependent sugar dehydrogenase, partial [Chondromyces sp.]|nr:PQQ-dependent sugar dehydrogenase [Chondromyces sp.]
MAAAWILFAATGGASEPPSDLVLELVADGFAGPVAVTGAGDGSGRLFVVEQQGRIRIVGGGTLLDIASKVKSGGEQGLLGLAFHPDYSDNGHFYVNYTYDPPGVNLDVTRVSRFAASAADPDLADPASETILLEFEQDFGNHNGGDLHFGPDGYLYIASGDGGGGGDPNDRGQSLDTLLGKILRLDVDSGSPYAVPADNPFVGDPAGLDEIWAYGLRNPWRFSFDRATGDLFIGDVGQGSREEVNRQPAGSAGGENYGWSCMEGDQFPGYNDCDGSPLTAPILVYGHGPGPECSVTGGFVYRGRIGGLHGRYVFGDYCSGVIWHAGAATSGWAAELVADTTMNISSFGEDDDGELLVVDRDDGAIFRFVSPS